MAISDLDINRNLALLTSRQGVTKLCHIGRDEVQLRKTFELDARHCSLSDSHFLVNGDCGMVLGKEVRFCDERHICLKCLKFSRKEVSLSNNLSDQNCYKLTEITTKPLSYTN